MIRFFSSVLMSYLAGAGVIANASIITRGLFKAVQRATTGRLSEAGVEALGALAAPSVLAFATTATMVNDAVETAYDLLWPALEEIDSGPKRKLAA